MKRIGTYTEFSILSITKEELSDSVSGKELVVTGLHLTTVSVHPHFRSVAPPFDFESGIHRAYTFLTFFTYFSKPYPISREKPLPWGYF